MNREQTMVYQKAFTILPGIMIANDDFMIISEKERFTRKE